MPDVTHSLSESVPMTCPVCGVQFSDDIWFIVNSVERPDLVARLKAGELNLVTCPNGHSGVATFALLLYLPEEEPAFVLSTFERFLSAESRRQGGALLGVLQSRMGLQDDSWQAVHIERGLLPLALQKGLRVYFRELEISNNEAHRHSSIPEPFFDSVATAQVAQKRFAETGSLPELKLAIEAWETILRHPSFATTEEWFRPAVFDDAGSAYLRHYQATEQSADLDRAAFLFNRALELTPADSPKLMGVLNNLGVCLREQYLLKGELADLRRAVEMVERAVALATSGATLSPSLLNLLGCVLDLLYLGTGNTKTIDAAIAKFQQAVALYPENSPRGAEILNNLGNSFRNRFSGSGDLTDLDAAIETFRRGLALNSPDSLNRATLLGNLGSSLHDRHLRTQQASDLDEAIRYFRSALSLLLEGTRDRGLTLSNLGAALRLRANRKDDGGLKDLQEAVLVSRQAVEELPTSAPDRALRLLNLATMIAEICERTGDISDFDTAIDKVVEARSLAGSNLLSRVNFNLGKMMQTRFVRTGSPDDLSAGISAFRESSEQGLAIGVEGSLYSSQTWLDWALERAAWKEAIEALDFGLRAEEILLNEQAVREHKESWLRSARGLHAGGAYALARHGDLRRAAVVLEEGRGRLLSEALERKDAKTGSISFAEIRSAAAISPLVYLAVTVAGGLALIISADGTIAPLWLESLGQSSLEEAMTGGSRVPRELSFLLAKSNWRFDRRPETEKNWMLSLERTTRWLWDALMGPLEQALGAQECQKVVLIPQGLLGLLPLHAAWREAPEDPRHRHTVLDTLEVSYSPNSKALLAARERVRDGRADSLCAIENPDGTLHFAEREVSEALSYFPGNAGHHLKGAAANVSNVRTEVAKANVLHFATHGEALPFDPLGSNLLLARGARLTLRDLLDMELRNVRLAVLSACETGVSGIALPDEMISLPTGFLQAGAAGIVSSLWSVSDASTMLLMVRFYELWRGEGRAPATALREAQIWLRDLTLEEVGSRLRQLNVEEEIGQRDVGQRRAAPAAFPFGHPFYWAAFTFTGA